MKKFIPSAMLVLATVCGTLHAGAVYQEPGFTDTTFISNTGLGNPTVIAWAPDGSRRLFVARKSGEVRIVKAGVALGTSWAVMSPIITAGECGLLGMCFDPSFLSNRYIYLLVTVSATEQQILRYVDDPATDTGSGRTVIVAGLPTTGQNHNGGCIGIGPDGKLYWSVGNTNNFTGSYILRGENGDVSNLCAKVGRANLDGSVPFDNPFYDGAGPNNDYVWARGLRNPFKFNFQPATGKLWVNCVGDNYEQVFVMNKSDDAGDRTRENIQTGSLITPVIKYRTNNVAMDTKPLAADPGGAVRSNNIVTFTTTAAHGYRKGENITVSGVTDASFNAQFFVASTPSATTFTVAQSAVNAASGGGTATPLQISTGTSAAVTGACFYDSTLFAAQYRNNYFFGDVAGNRIMRSTLDTDNSVKSVNYFASNTFQLVDMTVGPDGALYYTGHSTTGAIFRVAPSIITPGLAVSPGNLRLMENGSAVLNVSLATAPAGTVQVAVQRSAGDSDITVTPATLTFTPANFSVPQTVLVQAAKDSDIDNDAATLSVSLSGLNTETVQVTAIDIDAGSPKLSSSAVTLTEGQTGSFTVALPMQPTSDVTVTLARSGDTDVTITSPTTLTFTSTNWSSPQPVNLAAANDADTTNDSATITVSGMGMTPGTVTVTVIDTTANAPQFTSAPVLTGVVSAPYSYQAAASGTPAPAFSLTTQPGGMTINSGSGLIAWTPAATGNFNVTVRAANGINPDATQSFTIAVSADQPPSAVISKPAQAEIISGTNTEFYGNGHDDVATVKAEFYVDNVLRYTDSTPGDHYHIFGSHLLFDTTIYSNGPHHLKMTVYDTAGQSGSHELDVTIQNKSAVAPGTASGVVGVAFSYQVMASNEPTGYAATGLPNGLAIDAANGLISGTPAQNGNFNVDLSVTNAAGTSAGTLALTISPAPILAPVVSGGSASGTIGQAFTYQILATNAPDTFAVTGLPAGLSLNPNTGAISGQPSADGSFTVQLSATNAGGTGTTQLALTINPAPEPPILAPAVFGGTASGTVGQSFTYQIISTNSPDTYAATGLPAGLSLDPSTGIISGQPSVEGSFTVQLSATNAGGTGTAQLALTINPMPISVLAPVVADGSVGGTIGQALMYQIVASNSPDSFAATGLPAGLSINPNTGVISGQPGAAGSFAVQMSATNAGGTGTAQLALTISPAPVIVLAPVVNGGSASGTVGQAFTYQIVASNAPESYAAAGLPAGLSINPNTGVISGQPSTAGSFTVQLSATNAGGTGTTQLALTIGAASVPPPPTVSAPVVAGGSAAGRVGQVFSYQIVASNSPGSFTAAGLPDGLVLSAASGLISGSPSVAGTFTIQLSAANAGGTGTATLTLTVNADHAPVFVSSISFAPNPLHAGVEAVFNSAASDEDGDPLSISWNFGDGSAAAGESVTHTFAASGIYRVQAALNGGATTEILLPVFPRPNDTGILAFKSAALKLNFASVKRNSLKVTGTVPGTLGGNVMIGIGAFEHTYAAGDKKLRLTASKKDGSLKFTLTLAAAELAPLLPQFPNANISTPGQFINLPVTMSQNESTYVQMLPLRYTSKAGRSASAKLADDK